MATPDDWAGSLSEYVENLVRLARIGEVLERLAADSTQMIATLERVSEIDSALAPELAAGLGHLAEFSEAIARLNTFVLARHEIDQERFAGAMSPNERGSEDATE